MALPLELSLKVFQELATVADFPYAPPIHAYVHPRKAPPVDKDARRAVFVCASLCRASRRDLLPLIFHRIDDEKLQRPEAIIALLDIIHHNPLIASYIASLRLGVRLNYLRGAESDTYDAAMNSLLLRLQDSLLELQLQLPGLWHRYYQVSMTEGVPQILARGRLQSLIYLDCDWHPVILKAKLPNLRSLYLRGTDLDEYTGESLGIVNLTIVGCARSISPRCQLPNLDTLALDVAQMSLYALPIIRQAPNLRCIISLYVSGTQLAHGDHQLRMETVNNNSITRLEWALASTYNANHDWETLEYRNTSPLSMLVHFAGMLRGLRHITARIHKFEGRSWGHQCENGRPMYSSMYEGWGDWKTLDKALDGYPLLKLATMEFDLTYLDLKVPRKAAVDFYNIVRRDMPQMCSRAIRFSVNTNPRDQWRARVESGVEAPREIFQDQPQQSSPLLDYDLPPSSTVAAGLHDRPPSRTQLTSWTFGPPHVPTPPLDQSSQLEDSDSESVSAPAWPYSPAEAATESPTDRKGKMKALMTASKAIGRKIVRKLAI